MSPYFALYTVENNKIKKSVKFQGDMLNFCDFIQGFVFTRNHHLKVCDYISAFATIFRLSDKALRKWDLLSQKEITSQTD